MSQTTQTIARESTDVLDQLMKPEVQQSLTVLVENLPKLAEMVTLLTKTYDVVQSLATDQVFIEDIKGGIGEVAMPIVEGAKNLAANAIEANDRAQAETATIGLFGLLKMLKDPQVQKTFRFAQAFLEISAERNQQKRQQSQGE
ncbi:Uncharacterized conserved protein YjgD, DUF1641 family [Paenibacillus sp. UNCCL117]|uniref:DUF1641 domain-containing protein n=1 Tax=unclassified Paenibacillus TaxID=185978 RepID=UPI0008841E0C|nr:MULTISPECIES: DUF1641 domain-containing protein [unclassified Paenibacillus]SDD13081.1 Uncharacterized conserved protein YjgD, DUF1641 family [Paenibacillus sp. cl123]SFW33914.1 Uncharacterized conserved protein YjgD, DUF1641 family [Paenibacillus sp. UNCCL117]